MLEHMRDVVTENYPHIPVCVHLDHGNEPATCMTAIQAGFTGIMMDGSLKADAKTPGDWDYKGEQDGHEHRASRRHFSRGRIGRALVSRNRTG
jgi:hypothetical protein